MTDIEKKALALMNEICAEMGLDKVRSLSVDMPGENALIRAIEQHEAFRQEVSDAIEEMLNTPGCVIRNSIGRFIIAKPDPLAEAWIEATGNTVGMEPLNEALAKRGGKIVWGGE